MAATLQEALLAPAIRPQLITDCQALIEQEVSEKSGISGTAVKLAYKTVSTFAAGHVRHMLEVLLPDMADKLQPYWTEFHASGGSDFGDYLAKRGPEVADSLLAVTDARAAGSSKAPIKKAYSSVRGSAGKHVEAALPHVGALVQRYAG